MLSFTIDTSCATRGARARTAPVCKYTVEFIGSLTFLVPGRMGSGIRLLDVARAAWRSMLLAR